MPLSSSGLPVASETRMRNTTFSRCLNWLLSTQAGGRARLIAALEIAFEEQLSGLLRLRAVSKAEPSTKPPPQPSEIS